MTVGEAKNIARQWVEEQEKQIENFHGAFFSGSFNFKDDDELWENWSDIDIWIIVDGEVPDRFVHRRFVYRGVLFDPWYAKIAEWLKPENLLSNNTFAYHFAVNNIISDPTGNLTKIQKAVEKDYAKIEWVRKRCGKARKRAEESLMQCMDEKQETVGPHDQIQSLISSSANITNVPVLAALAIPTARRCFINFREIITQYDYPRPHETILKLLGASKIRPDQVDLILENASKAFDRAVQLVPSQPTSMIEAYYYDICRPYLVDGSRQMMEEGDYREAVPFMMLFFRGAIEAIEKYSPENDKERYIDSYRNSADSLGFTSKHVIIERAKKLKQLLPEIMDVTEYIIKNNPNIAK